MARSGASGMEISCDHCKRYLDHLDEKNQSMSCFLRRMTAGPKHIMIVPNKFLKHFAGKLSQAIKLESPNGSVYNVEVTECYNKMVLGDGWEKFVGAHHIEENDFLLFQHIENSVFKVLIFDSDGFEKIICCNCIKSIPSVGETRVDYVDISSSSQFDIIGSSGILSTRHGENLKMTVTSSSSGGSGEDIPSENESFESDDLQAPGADYIVPHLTYLSQEQKERVNLLIKEIQPETTVYIAVMQKSHVHPPYPSVELGSRYASAVNLPAGGQTLVLWCGGNIWKTNIVIMRQRRYLCGGWPKFVHDNGLALGDICLFELKRNERKLTVMVHIIPRKDLY